MLLGSQVSCFVSFLRMHTVAFDGFREQFFFDCFNWSVRFGWAPPGKNNDDVSDNDEVEQDAEKI